MPATVSTTEKIQSLQKEFEGYVEVLSPVAKYINDVANGKVPSWAVVDAEEAVLDQLVRCQKANLGDWKRETAACMIEQWRNYKPVVGDNAVWKVCRYMHPGLKMEGPQITSEEFTKVIQIEVPQEEWDLWEEATKTARLHRDEYRHPSKWYEKYGSKFPALRLVV